MTCQVDLACLGGSPCLLAVASFGVQQALITPKIHKRYEARLEGQARGHTVVRNRRG